jgi:hypothetical protein
MDSIDELEKRYYTHSPRKVQTQDIESSSSEGEQDVSSSSEDSDIYLASDERSDHTVEQIELKDTLDEHKIRSKSLMSLSKKVII